MATLRDPENGCPWDLKQTFRSLRGYLLEECYEAIDALDRESLPELKDELGDLLLQVVFLSRIAEEQGAFTAADVVESISGKMIRRHPHIFGDVSADSSEEVLRQWEEIKQQEKADRGETAPESVLDGLPPALPALPKAQRLGEKASRVGFDWERPEQILEKVREETAELSRAMQSETLDRQEEELGDLLFAVAMLSRRLRIDPEGALERANRKFRNRFERLERRSRSESIPIADAGLELLEHWWNEIKSAEKPDR